MLKDRVPKHHHEDPILLQKNEILPGQQVTAKLNAGTLPSGSNLSLIAHVFRSKNPGPCLLLSGGIHGDEVNGIQIITSILESNILTNINRGTVIAIPLINVYGFNNSTRDLPDGRDLNRSFPGSSGGSLASRLARVITKQILPFIDIAIDYHTAAVDRYNFPQTRYTKSDPLSKELTDIFSAPFNLPSALIYGSFRKAASDMNVTSIVYEAGESSRINQKAIEYGINGTIRVLKELELIKIDKPIPINTKIEINKSDWIRASKPGIFIWFKKSGDSIHIGDTLAVIKDPYGLNEHEVISKVKGYIIGHNNAAIVNQGDPLFNIGLI
jgi:uncharacterized protein